MLFIILASTSGYDPSNRPFGSVHTESFTCRFRVQDRLHPSHLCPVRTVCTYDHAQTAFPEISGVGGALNPSLIPMWTQVTRGRSTKGALLDTVFVETGALWLPFY